MSYHHYNRLTAHWQPKNLTPTARSVAQHLAQNIQSKGTYAGRYFHSAELIAEELGFSAKSVYTALGSLIAAGLFEAETIHRGTRLRTYSLALDCPPECQAKQHYTRLERAGRVSTEPDLTGSFYQLDTPLTGKTYQTYRELTNKEHIDIDIETFESLNVEKLDQLYLGTISKTLASLETKTANHLLLDTALVVNPALVLNDARALAEKATTKHPEAYLAKTTANSPESLLETFRAATSTEPAVDPRQYSEDEVSLIRAAALDVIGERRNEQERYNEYLLSSGAIPAELVEIVRAQLNDCTREQGFTSLEEAVAVALAVKHSIRVNLTLDPSLVVEVYEGSFKPERHDFGADAESYEHAVKLDKKREQWEDAFLASHAEIVDSWLKVHTDQTLEEALKLDQIEANEQARAANPELAVDREHYTRLILTELHQLPAIETLADFLAGNENLSAATEQVAQEFTEFWNAYPSRPEGKGRKITALKGWLEARKNYDHASLMNDLKIDFNGTSAEFVKFPASWLDSYTKVQTEAEQEYY